MLQNTLGRPFIWPFGLFVVTRQATDVVWWRKSSTFSVSWLANLSSTIYDNVSLIPSISNYNSLSLLEKFILCRTDGIIFEKYGFIMKKYSISKPSNVFFCRWLCYCKLLPLDCDKKIVKPRSAFNSGRLISVFNIEQYLTRIFIKGYL